MRSAEYDRDAVLRKRHGSLSRQRLCQDHHAGSWWPQPACTRAASMPPLATSAARCWRRSITMWQRGPAPRCLAQPSPLAGLHAFLEQVVDDALQGSCLLVRTLMELASGTRSCTFASRPSMASWNRIWPGSWPWQRRRESWQKRGHPHPRPPSLQVHIRGLVTFAQCHPDRPLLAGVVARMMSALR